MVSVLVSSAVDRGFEPRTGQTKEYNIGICCFSAKHDILPRAVARGTMKALSDNPWWKQYKYITVAFIYRFCIWVIISERINY
jgi:hypothetical protein